MKSKYPVVKLSLLNFWLTVFFFVLGFISAMTNFDAADFKTAISQSFLGAIILILNAFANLALLLIFEVRLSVSKLKGRKIFLILSYGSSLLIFIMIALSYAASNRSPIHLWSFLYMIIISILINTLILILQNYILIHEGKANADIENSRLKAANADAANQLLRQQIHPHFLFNALNILKSLYKINQQAGEEYLVRLSDFLRAAVSTNNTKVIPLKDELKLCTDYLEMQKIRFGLALTYSISVSDEILKTGFVPSFSIHPLLENAIKHNELTQEAPLHIQIQVVGNRIKVTNNLKLKASSETSTGSGLTNLSERYRLLSNDELIIEKYETTFSVSIKILSHENNNY